MTTYRVVWHDECQCEGSYDWPRWKLHDGPDPRGEANLHVAQLAARGIEATVHRIDGSDK